MKKKNSPGLKTGAVISAMVRLVRVELTTCRLGGGRSIHLSYNRNNIILSNICYICKSYPTIRL